VKHPMCVLGVIALAGLAQAQQQGRPARMGTESGFGIFQQKCMTCHGKADAPEKAPDPQQLRQLSPERILDALTNGVMKIQGQSLSDEEKRRVAESVSGRLLGTATAGDAKTMPNHCSANPPMKDPASGPAWNGWGVDASNTRFQPAKAAGLTADNVGNLKLKWAFGFPGGLSAFGQPSVVAGRVFVGSDNGYIYSLDAGSGCVYWSFQALAGVRNAMTVGPVKGRGNTKYAVFFGDLKGTMYAVDAQTGAQLWTDHPEQHFTARFTAAPTFYDGKLYAGISSWEEFSARTLDYPCCTSRGSVVAWDANTGKRLWHSYVIPEEPKPVRKNSQGVQLWAPAGASVWNSPTVDPKRKLIYVGTGDATTEPAAKTSDAVVAMDMATGKIVWSYQAEENDAFLVGCNGANRTENCPTVNGPDYDIGNSPILRTLSNGKSVLVAGTKNGFVFALDPDKNGALLWRTEVSKNAPGTPLQRVSGIVWGGAADPQFAYFGLSGGGVAAVQLATGERTWFNPLGTDEKNRIWNAAGTTAIPGVVFVPGGDGKLHALSSKDGKSLWEYDSNQSFETVNKVPAKGGSIRAPGITVAGGMVFAGSGYGFGGGDIPGNVLLAFSTK
jgi:polyvinyl alcohol dehydrogenase (cytochrome)